MLCIYSESLDPYFNLATEEYLLKNFDEDIFMIWRGEESVVIGKHQNPAAEINALYLFDNNIKLARRLSGGGTVFHDEGNLNFTFIKNGEAGKLVDFKRFTQPIVNFLNTLGVKAYHSGRNDLLVDEFKFSGNAEHVYKKRVLHHGTILFNSQLDKLDHSLQLSKATITDKSVKSNRSKVTNIYPYLKEGLSLKEFMMRLFEYVPETVSGSRVYSLSSTDLESIQKLRDEKYSQWEWIYGYTGKYHFEKEFQMNGNLIYLSFTVVKGLINDIQIDCSSNDNSIGELIFEELEGIPHDPSKVLEKLNTVVQKLKELKLSPRELLKNLF